MAEEKTFIVETSAHHIHVTQKTLDFLFEGQPLGIVKELSQPGMFASDKKLDIVYHAKIKDKKTGELKDQDFTIKNLRILGPVRSADQVEISMTEARTLHAAAPVRESGVLDGTPAITLVNPLNGRSVDTTGLIVAKRHIHMAPKDAEEFGVKNGDIVAVKIKSANGRSAILGDTVIRVSEHYALAMHIDTDESNAVGGASKGVFGSLVKIDF
ncbi:MAG: PduL/EutD family phosphate acyltransferase [Bacilli bacterium]